MAVRADERKVPNVLVEVAGDAANGRIGIEKPILMQNEVATSSTSQHSGSVGRFNHCVAKKKVRFGVGTVRSERS
jgi:hypothetical protein